MWDLANLVKELGHMAWLAYDESVSDLSSLVLRRLVSFEDQAPWILAARSNFSRHLSICASQHLGLLASLPRYLYVRLHHRISSKEWISSHEPIAFIRHTVGPHR